MFFEWDFSTRFHQDAGVSANMRYRGADGFSGEVARPTNAHVAAIDVQQLKPDEDKDQFRKT